MGSRGGISYLDISVVLSWAVAKTCPLRRVASKLHRVLRTVARYFPAKHVRAITHLLLDPLVFLMPDGTTGDCSGGRANQSACCFVVTLVSNRNSECRTRQTTEDDAATTMASILCGYLSAHRDKQQSDDESLLGD